MKLNIQVLGNGSDLIILHGLFGSGDNWLTIGKHLSENFRIHLVDQRNHGKSIHCEKMSYPLMATDLKEYIVESKLSKVILIGHSMGGKTAMQFANDHPNYLDKLIIVDIAPKRYSDHHSDLIKALLELDLSSAKSRSDLDKKLIESIRDSAVRQFLLKNVYRNSDGEYEWKMNIAGLKSNYDAIMEAPEIHDSITTPTLFINGIHSSYIQPDDRELIKKSFLDVQFESIDAGHWLHAESPEKFIEIVREWLNKKQIDF